MHLAQAAQEEHEGAGERRHEPGDVPRRAEMREDARRDEPGQVDRDLVGHLERTETAEILPLDGFETRIAEDLEGHRPSRLAQAYAFR